MISMANVNASRTFLTHQFSSINLYFTNTFCLLLPLGFLCELSKLTEKLGENIIWLAIPLSALLGWVTY